MYFHIMTLFPEMVLEGLNERALPERQFKKD